MKISKPLKIIGIVVCSLLILAVVGNLTINALIKNQLPKIIDERNDTAYQLIYDDINFSVFSNSLSIVNAEIKPKANVNIKKDIDFFGKVEKIRSEEHTSELQSRENVVCRLLREKKKENE